MNKLILLSSAIFILLIDCGHCSRIEAHVGRAYLDKEKKKPIYVEKHTAFYEEEKLKSSTNDYYDLHDKKIAELNSDYSKSIIMPTYIFRDLRNESEEGLKFENNKYFIFKKEKGKAEILKYLENTVNMFSCQGWHYYLIDNLNSFKSGSLQMNLLFPAKLDYYSFRLRPLELNSNIIKLRLEFDSWIMRLFTPHLDLTYDSIMKKIIQYYGPSNILSENGKIYNVFIFYE